MKWDSKYKHAASVPDEPAQVLQQLLPWIPRHGTAADLAAGAGRNGIWLAEQGLQVTLYDISPVALRLAEQRAAERGVAVECCEYDLEAGPLPNRRFDLVLTHLFLWRPLIAKIDQLLNRGGRFVMIQPTVRNLERHDRPPREFLLGEQELASLLPDRLTVHKYHEGWGSDGRHDAIVVAEQLDTDDGTAGD